MKKSIFILLTLFFSFSFTSNAANEILSNKKATEEKPSVKPLKLIKILPNYCYDQVTVTACGTFYYPLCYNSEPTMNQLLNDVYMMIGRLERLCSTPLP